LSGKDERKVRMRERFQEKRTGIRDAVHRDKQQQKRKKGEPILRGMLVAMLHSKEEVSDLLRGIQGATGAESRKTA